MGTRLEEAHALEQHAEALRVSGQFAEAERVYAAAEKLLTEELVEIKLQLVALSKRRGKHDVAVGLLAGAVNLCARFGVDSRPLQVQLRHVRRLV
jgi:hypothetical protein